VVWAEQAGAEVQSVQARDVTDRMEATRRWPMRATPPSWQIAASRALAMVSHEIARR